MTPRASRRNEILVAPIVTAGAVLGILIIARFYDRLPVRAPRCGFREAFEIPCIGCGGTRAIQALAQGDITGAFSLNPAAILSVFVIFFWLFRRLHQWRKKIEPPRNPNRWRVGLVLVACGLVLNWLYLLFFLPA